MKEKLESFLKSPKNSRTRESLINYRLFYDLKYSAILKSYDLTLYTSDTDQDGFDIVLDDGDTIHKVQLKTVLGAASTSSWQIHKGLLRPTFAMAKDLGFSPTPETTGVQGGVVLVRISISDNSELDLRYFYTDLLVLRALQLLSLRRNPSNPTTKSLENYFSSLQSGPAHEKITVSKSFFVEAKNPSSLMGLMGLGSISDSSWRSQLYRVCERRYSPQEPDPDNETPTEVLEEQSAKDLISLVNNLEMK